MRAVVRFAGTDLPAAVVAVFFAGGFLGDLQSAVSIEPGDHSSSPPRFSSGNQTLGRDTEEWTGLAIRGRLDGKVNPVHRARTWPTWVFLASDESRYITGQQIRVDAGSLLKRPNGPGGQSGRVGGVVVV